MSKMTKDVSCNHCTCFHYGHFQEQCTWGWSGHPSTQYLKGINIGKNLPFQTIWSAFVRQKCTPLVGQPSMLFWSDQQATEYVLQLFPKRETRGIVAHLSFKHTSEIKTPFLWNWSIHASSPVGPVQCQYWQSATSPLMPSYHLTICQIISHQCLPKPLTHAATGRISSPAHQEKPLAGACLLLLTAPVPASPSTNSHLTRWWFDQLIRWSSHCHHCKQVDLLNVPHYNWLKAVIQRWKSW